MFKKFAIFIICTLLNTSLYAEVITDGTLGRATSVPGNTLSGKTDFPIGSDLGQQRGGNLFHSFQEFNLQYNESATFYGPNNVQNVISRVTGGNPSEIDGLIRSTIPNADMYFLNPYGIMFGPNARLDVQGSFHASTAHYLRLDNGGRFYARNPSDSLLTIAPVEAFGFLDQPVKAFGFLDQSEPIQSIEIQGSFLKTPVDKTLSIVGGDIFITDGVLFAESGRINLVSVASAGEIIPKINDIQVTATEKGSIEIIQSSWSKLKEYTEEIPIALANLDVTDFQNQGGAQIFIRAGQLILDKALIYAITYGETGSNITGSNIDVSVDGNIELYDGASITADSDGSRTHEGNQVTIKSQHGRILISGENTEAYEAVVKAIGEEKTETLIAIIHVIPIVSEALSLNDNSDPQQVILDWLGDPEAVDNAEFLLGVIFDKDGYLLETEQAIENAIGYQDATLALAAIEESITIPIANFEDDLLPDGSTIATNNFGFGQRSNIHIFAPTLELVDGGYISTTTETSGNAGHVEIHAQDIRLQDTRLQDIRLPNGSHISKTHINTSTTATGQAGNIIIKGFNQSKAENISITDGSQITASSDNFYNAFYYRLSGDAGNIDINTRHLNLESGGVIAGLSYHGTGKAGTIRIETDRALLTGEETAIYTESDTGGGNIFLTVHDRVDLFDNSRITAEAFGENSQDKGGNITIENPGIFTLNNSQLLANAYAGDGGRIDISTSDFRIAGNSRIDVSSVLGFTGEFWLNKVKLRDDFLVLSLPGFQDIGLSLDRCAGLTREELSSFQIILRDTMPESPTDLKTHFYFSP